MAVPVHSTAPLCNVDQVYDSVDDLMSNGAFYAEPFFGSMGPEGVSIIASFQVFFFSE